MITQRVTAFRLEHFIDSQPIWWVRTLGGFEILCDCVVYCIREYPKNVCSGNWHCVTLVTQNLRGVSKWDSSSRSYLTSVGFVSHYFFVLLLLSCSPV